MSTCRNVEKLGCGDASVRADDALGTAAAAAETLQGTLAHGKRPAAVLEDAWLDLPGGPALLLRLRGLLRQSLPARDQVLQNTLTRLEPPCKQNALVAGWKDTNTDTKKANS